MVVAAVDGGLHPPPARPGRVHALVGAADPHEDRTDARLAPEQGSDVLRRERPALGVGEHDRDAPLDLAGKKFRVASAESAPSVVAVRFQFTGGGWSMPTDRSSVAENTSLSGVGNRCGSSRSVIDAIPAGT